MHEQKATRCGLWASGTACWSQEDGASLLGPELYRDLIFPIIDKAVRDKVRNKASTNLSPRFFPDGA
ncbi:MAG: hypothetical protein ACLFWL_17410 [Candidatus Brocadiia bacterium]